MKPLTKVRKFRKTRYPHKRSEGLTVRRTNGATKELIRTAQAAETRLIENGQMIVITNAGETA
ncbi:hypothetical protein PV729_04300 [Streptomyces europaeiscabiei]|uniref:Uncharacterized protein n=1 Tax=Streptomyces europaeiscabiei TaxID=146819 RepID=A0ABU4N6T3_9ACTN|nr:hypothetical protein [Streptomyces europaeiscabiei]MDX3550999.1 hypothetical protein [Streptomyces europaeiscabiei]MDX3698441.1 hypothetical protein [Streptomyces europaeiscabiei]